MSKDVNGEPAWQVLPAVQEPPLLPYPYWKIVLPLSPVGIAQVAVLTVPDAGEKAKLSTLPAQLLPMPVTANVVVWNDCVPLSKV